ncbi:MAG: MetQ/NlpA family ABC transporter substrate-binding protein [Mesosutterella sp.]|nr:MetQ/NlpA family ABC transporter substrate-binding protein [Mesosutterella sp.]
MQKRQLLKAFVAVPLLSALALSGCSKKETVVKVGATAGPHAEVVEAAAKEAAKDGLKVQVVEFSDYLGPDKALAEKSLDLNVYQHEPFLKNFNANQKTDLVSVGPAILMRMGIYSNKVKSPAELRNGALIGIPNDPTNGGRGLQLLEAAGLIKLREGAGFKATVADVVDNPKKLVLKELEAAQLPRSLDDLDAGAITMNYVMSAGLDPSKQDIFLEGKDAPLAVMVIAARPDNKDSEAVKKFVKAYHSEAVKKFIADKYKGTIVPAW